MTGIEGGAEDRVRAGLADAARAHEAVSGETMRAVVEAARAIEAALREGRRVLVFGNGGSAAEAQHFAAELMGRFERERAAWPAVALTTDTSALTAIGNDYGFEQVFARQIEGLGQRGDVALGISTSGASANVVEGLRMAARRGLTTIALTGRDGGEMGTLAAVHVNVPLARTARIQEVQLTLLHIVCELVESAMAGSA
jgi:D-sedoheptulose 7-phosphate isomerase